MDVIKKEEKLKINERKGVGFYFCFINGVEFGPFKTIEAFNEETGTFKSKKKDESIVYIDLLGRELLKPIKTSKVYADYLNMPVGSPYREIYEFHELITAVKNLPTTAFRDVEFVVAVLEEESRRKEEFIKNKLFKKPSDADKYEKLYKKTIDNKQADAFLMMMDRRRYVAKVFNSIKKERNLLREVRRRHIAKILGNDNKVRNKEKKERKLHIAHVFHEMNKAREQEMNFDQ